MYMKVAIIIGIYHKSRNNLVGIREKRHNTEVYHILLKRMLEGFLGIINFL